MVRQDGEKADIDDEVGDQQLQTIDYPLAAVIVVPAGQGVLSEQVRTSAAATPAMVDPGLAFANQFPRTQAGIRGAPAENRIGDERRCVPLPIRAPFARLTHHEMWVSVFSFSLISSL